MTVRGRLLSCLVTMVLALAGFVTAGALPATAAPSTIQYVALGDSYAAGTAIQPCTQSEIGYPVFLDLESRITLTKNAACSGATTDTVVLPPELNSARLVTLTVGAGDLGLSRVLDACTNPQTPGACQAEIGRALALVQGCPVDEDTLGGDLIELYGKVAKAARGARIVVTGYPLLFESPDPVNDAIKTAINKATTDLNCVIKQAVAASQATYANIYYVDVTKEFAEHGIVTAIANPDDPDVFIHSQFTCDPRTRPDCTDPQAFHPTKFGYQAYADAIKTKLPAGWLDKSST